MQALSQFSSSSNNLMLSCEVNDTVLTIQPLNVLRQLLQTLSPGLRDYM
jgi:hypothetical protein